MRKIYSYVLAACMAVALMCAPQQAQAVTADDLVGSYSSVYSLIDIASEDMAVIEKTGDFTIEKLTETSVALKGIMGFESVSGTINADGTLSVGPVGIDPATGEQTDESNALFVMAMGETGLEIQPVIFKLSDTGFEMVLAADAQCSVMNEALGAQFALEALTATKKEEGTVTADDLVGSYSSVYSLIDIASEDMAVIEKTGDFTIEKLTETTVALKGIMGFESVVGTINADGTLSVGPVGIDPATGEQTDESNALFVMAMGETGLEIQPVIFKLSDTGFEMVLAADAQCSVMNEALGAQFALEALKATRNADGISRPVSNANDVQIVVNNGEISFCAANVQPVSIYTVDGFLVKTCTTANVVSGLAKGTVYVIRVNGISKKVVL